MWARDDVSEIDRDRVLHHLDIGTMLGGGCGAAMVAGNVDGRASNDDDD
jgi:hypothetical protein